MSASPATLPAPVHPSYLTRAFPLFSGPDLLRWYRALDHARLTGAKPTYHPKTVRAAEHYTVTSPRSGETYAIYPPQSAACSYACDCDAGSRNLVCWHKALVAALPYECTRREVLADSARTLCRQAGLYCISCGQILTGPTCPDCDRPRCANCATEPVDAAGDWCVGCDNLRRQWPEAVDDNELDEIEPLNETEIAIGEQPIPHAATIHEERMARVLPERCPRCGGDLRDPLHDTYC